MTFLATSVSQLLFAAASRPMSGLVVHTSLVYTSLALPNEVDRVKVACRRSSRDVLPPSWTRQIQNALGHLEDRERDQKDKEMVKDIVTSVVAALVPIMSSMFIPAKTVSIPDTVKADITIMKYALDEQEQYTKKDNIRIRGIPVTQGEDTNKIVVDLAKEIGVQITSDDISTSHRLGSGPTSTIICRLVRRDVKKKIMKNKKALKGSKKYKAPIFIDEHLTPLRVKMLKAICEDSTIEAAWSIDGKLLCKSKQDPGRTTVLNNPDALFPKLGWDVEKVSSAGLIN